MALLVLSGSSRNTFTGLDSTATKQAGNCLIVADNETLQVAFDNGLTSSGLHRCNGIFVQVAA